MSFGIKELVVILVIVMLVFGTKKIRGVGSDVGGWIKDFRKAMKDGHTEQAREAEEKSKPVIEAEVTTTVESQSEKAKV